MRRALSILGIAVIMAGCVPSLNPLFTAGDLTFDTFLLGKWKQSDSSATWEFSKAGEKEYRLVQTDADGQKAAFQAHLVRLKGQRFLDVYLKDIVEPELKMNGLAAFSLIPGHLILHVPEIGSTLKIAAMNSDWLSDHLKTNPDAIAHRRISDDRVALIASTKDLQEFVLRHVGQEGLFGGPMALEQAGKEP